MTQPVIHTVVFSLKHPVESELAKKFLEDGRHQLTQIPGVEKFEVRRQVSPKSNFQFGFSMEFLNYEVYESYNVHPLHVDFVENRWKKEVTDFQELDFEVIK